MKRLLPGILLLSLFTFATSSSAGQLIAWGWYLESTFGAEGSRQMWLPSTLTGTNVIAIAAAQDDAVALTSDGNVTIWGDHMGVNPNAPIVLTNVAALATGISPFPALRSDGTLVGSGYIPPGLSNVVAVSSAPEYDLALKSDGTVVAWGLTYLGVPYTPSPTNVPPGLSNVVSIWAGVSHCLALEADGSVTTWGKAPTNPPPDLADSVAVRCGFNRSMVLKSDGTVRTWGPPYLYLSGPTNIPATLINVVGIADGAYHGLALRGDGIPIAWGSYLKDYLGNIRVPAFIPTNLNHVVAIAAGNDFDLALVADDPFPVCVELFNPTMETNGFSVTVQTERGKVYRLEHVDGFNQTWAAHPMAVGSGGPMVLTDPSPPLTQRFYRVSRW